MIKSKIAITMGDPAGIGPEVICKTLINKDFTKNYDLHIIGWKHIIEDTFTNMLKIDSFPDFNIIEPIPTDIKTINYGEINSFYGKMSMLCVEKAVQLVKEKKLDAICTCPINKKSIQLAGYPYSGHTEYLGDMTNSSDFSMMLMGNKIKVVLVTTHTPMKDLVQNITIKNIVKAITNAHNTGYLFGNSTPKIAVCGLNPHAGDNGAIGDEEQNIISLAIEQCKNFANVTGPYSADGLFPQVLEGKYDFVIVMYHDQGLIPVKMESFGNAVNITLNLPIIRTSVDHGTAFDIAGQNIANNGSLKRAIEIADLMVKNA